MDWGAGTYEHIAAQLLPATHAALAQAARDARRARAHVGCGTGSATLLAAERGAQATGVDPAERLLEVARDAARARGVQASFLRGEAAALPVADASADAVVSVFGVVFAPDATAACAELARVTAPAGRIVLSAWIPAGALFDVARVRARAMAAPDTTPAPPPFAWHDREALSAAFSPWGLTAATDERRLAFAAASPEEFLESELRDHPLWVAARASLAAAELDRAAGLALQILRDGNEEPGGFRLTSRYVVATLRRP